MDENRVKIPKIGFGTYGIPPESVETLVRSAILAGYRHFDCAFLYKNEQEIGKTLNSCIDQGLVKREELFITSKLPMNGMRPKKVSYFLSKSLKNLDLKYIDLYLIHAPWAVKYSTDDAFYPCNPDSDQLDVDLGVDYKDTWKELEKACDSGLVRMIGISNFNENQLKDLVSSARIKPAVFQIEMHCYLPQKKLRELCSRNGIIVEAFAPLGSPKSARSFGKKILLEDATIHGLARKHNKTPAQILIRWLQQIDVIPIVGSDTVGQLRENISLEDLQLPAEDMALIEKIDRGERIYYFEGVPGTRQIPNYPFK